MQDIITEIARRYGTTPEAVREEISAAIQIGMTQTDKSTQEQWEKIPHQADAAPTADELICYLAALVKCYSAMS